MCAYPIGKIRRDMGAQEYNNYRYNWYLFNSIWSYNYTVSTLRGPSGTFLNYWQFASNDELQRYRNGQIAHDSFYSNAPLGQFASIGTG
jgi:hypothetical protein